MPVQDSTRHALRTSLGHSAATEIIRLLDRLSDDYAAEDDPARTTDEPNPGPDPNEAGVPVEPVTDASDAEPEHDPVIDPVVDPAVDPAVETAPVEPESEPEEDHADEVEAADADVVA